MSTTLSAAPDVAPLEQVPTCYLCATPGRVSMTDLSDQLFGAPGRWQLRTCNACELIWLDPRPRSLQLADLYETYYHYTHTADFGQVGRLNRLWQRISTSVLATAFGYTSLPLGGAERLAGRLVAQLPWVRQAAGSAVLWQPARPGARLLDVGCGAGQFLARMRDLGWRVHGVETDPRAAQVARDHYRLAISQATLDSADSDLPPGSFDLITLSHVIEHVPDPIDVLARCRTLLAPGGRLVVVTPNADSLGRRILGHAWFLGWSPPWHFHVFSAQTLRTCVTRAGFNAPAEIRTTARGARLAWITDRLLPRRGTLPAVTARDVSWRLRFESLAFWTAESLLVLVQPVGEEIVLVAQRDDGTI